MGKVAHIATKGGNVEVTDLFVAFCCCESIRVSQSETALTAVAKGWDCSTVTIERLPLSEWSKKDQRLFFRRLFPVFDRTIENEGWSAGVFDSLMDTLSDVDGAPLFEFTQSACGNCAEGDDNR